MPSVKKNLFFKTLLTVSSYLIAFITFPYITRVLGVEKLGIINFVDNTINTFLLFATMGISLLGTREIAMVKNDYQERSIVFTNILGLNLLFTFIVLFSFVVSIILVPQLQEHKYLFYIGTSKILFTAFVVEWFYTGIESFKYITYRTLLIRIAYVIAVFVFVRAEEDYVLYFVLTISIVLLNAVVNFLHVRRYISIKWLWLFRFSYIRESLTLGIYNLMTSMYITFNVMFLGFVSSKIEVGYYSTAFKLYSVILSLFYALTEVMLPRMSSLMAIGDSVKFNVYANRSLSIIINISIPIIIVGTIMAPQIVSVIAGPGYEGAVFPMQIIMFALLPVGIAQVLSRQILLPMKKERILLLSSILGGIMAVVINILLVGYLKSVGSAVVLLLSEYLVTLTYIIYIRKKKILNFTPKTISRELICVILLSLSCKIISAYIHTPIYSLLLIVLVGIIIYGTMYLDEIVSYIMRKNNYAR